jgi:hypothetical protein
MLPLQRTARWQRPRTELPGDNTLKFPTLALFVYVDSTVQFDCYAPNPQLFRLDPIPPNGITAVNVPLALGTPSTLKPGLYHLQSAGNVSCAVVSGNCSVMLVTNGEDPWPTPPKPLEALTNYPAAVASYFSAP